MENRNLKWVKDLIEFDDFELGEKRVRFNFYSYGKVKDVKYLGQTSQIKSVTVVKYLNLEDYINGGSGFPIEKEYMFSDIPPQINFIVRNRAIFDKGFILEGDL